MFVPVDHIDETMVIGAKARKLKELYDAGYTVPVFGVLDAQGIDVLLRADTAQKRAFLQEVQAAVVKKVPATLYAVRSAALIEDGGSQSMAGRFSTKLSVAPSDLPQAIEYVALDAAAKLGDAFNQFSIIIQEFVQPDYAGVMFTRNPAGGRDVVIEWNDGVGESVVGGEAVRRIHFLDTNTDTFTDVLPVVAELASTARSIEAAYDWPQDIEWAVKTDVVYVLQTRPITTITKPAWRGIKRLPEIVDTTDEYVYQKTALAETFQNPTPLAVSMLTALYAPGGPIARVYKALGVSYQDTNQIQHIGNSIYVDTVAETKSLFPALGHIKKRTLTPHFETVSGLFTTIRNAVQLSLLSARCKSEDRAAIHDVLTMPLPSAADVGDRWNLFLSHYHKIFTVNLRSQRSVLNLKYLLKNELHHLPELLHFDVDSSLAPKDVLVGNSLSIDDRSVFTLPAGRAVNPEHTGAIEEWMTSLPTWKREGLKKPIARAQAHMQLREEARWATARLVSYIRDGIDAVGHTHFPDESDLVYFATIDEIISNSFDERVLRERQEVWGKDQAYEFPPLIASFVPQDSAQKECALAPGMAVGTLVEKADVHLVSGPVVLYTKILTPDLTEYIPHVKGIVTEEGGLLSHMAIVARESGVPVVRAEQAISLTPRRRVEIDGTRGTINFLE